VSIDSTAELHHFNRTKDILYFHTLFGPAVLQGVWKRAGPTAGHLPTVPQPSRPNMSKPSAHSFTRAATCRLFRRLPLRYDVGRQLSAGNRTTGHNLDEFATR